MPAINFLGGAVQLFDNNGNPLAQGKVHTYAAGTSNPKASYPTQADATALTNANANPLILDAAGRGNVWLNGLYKTVVKDAADNTIYTTDNVGSADPISTFDKNHVAGLGLSNNAVDAANDIDIAVGEARDDADSEDLATVGVTTKRLDAAWSVGSGAGGIDTGSKAANTLYAVWLIKRTDTGVVDALFSTSFSSPVMPANYTKKRLIGAVLTDAASAIIAFIQRGDEFRYTGALATEIIDTSITDNTFETGTLNAPPHCIARIYGNLENTTSTGPAGTLTIIRNGDSEIPPSNRQACFMDIAATGDFDHLAREGTVMTDGSRQIRYAAKFAGGTATINIRTFGFTMLTRSNP